MSSSMPDVVSLKRGSQIVEVETDVLSTDVIRRTFKVSYIDNSLVAYLCGSRKLF